MPYHDALPSSVNPAIGELTPRFSRPLGVFGAAGFGNGGFAVVSVRVSEFSEFSVLAGFFEGRTAGGSLRDAPVLRAVLRAVSRAAHPAKKPTHSAPTAHIKPKPKRPFRNKLD